MLLVGLTQEELIIGIKFEKFIQILNISLGKALKNKISWKFKI